MKTMPFIVIALTLVMVTALSALLSGCTGHLEFDPFAGAVDDGGAAPSMGTPNRPSTVGETTTGGTGGASSTPAQADARPEPAETTPMPVANADAAPAMGNTGGMTGYGTPTTGGTTGTGSTTGAAKDGGAASSATPDAAPVASGTACPSGFNVPDLFVKRCGGCHSAAAPAKGLDMVSANLAARVVNVKSTCNNKLLLGTTSPAAGHLLDKLAGAVTGCGAQMPAGSAAFTATEMACVKEWAIQAINKVTGGTK